MASSSADGENEQQRCSLTLDRMSDNSNDSSEIHRVKRSLLAPLQPRCFGNAVNSQSCDRIRKAIAQAGVPRQQSKVQRTI